MAPAATDNDHSTPYPPYNDDDRGDGGTEKGGGDERRVLKERFDTERNINTLSSNRLGAANVVIHYLAFAAGDTHTHKLALITFLNRHNLRHFKKPMPLFVFLTPAVQHLELLPALALLVLYY